VSGATAMSRQVRQARRVLHDGAPCKFPGNRVCRRCDISC
jgi:hypothetical protein